MKAFRQHLETPAQVYAGVSSTRTKKHDIRSPVDLISKVSDRWTSMRWDSLLRAQLFGLFDADVSGHTSTLTRGWAVWEVASIFVLLAIYAGSPPPDVNEAHYLAKAKHYWNPEWCPGDHFLGSRNAHVVFCYCVGWLTCWVSLPAAAWISRLTIWLAMAFAWRWLSTSLVPGPLNSILTAALFLVASHYGAMMGEWVVGGIEGKTIAYVLVTMALGALVRRRWNCTWILLGIAAQFHVLVGVWSGVAATAAWLLTSFERPPLREMLPGLLIGLLLSLPGLIPGLALISGIDREIIAEANHIYVFQRLSHHLVFHTRPWNFLVSHLGLIAVWILLSTPAWTQLPYRRLHAFVAGAILIALIGLLIELSTVAHPDWSTALLRYYWFRLSDAVVPMGVAISAVFCVRIVEAKRPRWAVSFRVSLMVLAAVGLGTAKWERFSDTRPGAHLQAWRANTKSGEAKHRRYRDWRRVCAWIESSTSPKDRFLTPLRQQTFKWYASRSEVVTWKDIPQDATHIVEWWQRIQDIHQEHHANGRWSWLESLTLLDEARLFTLGRKYKCDFILLDCSGYEPRISDEQRVYPFGKEANETYAVYAIPP